MGKATKNKRRRWRLKQRLNAIKTTAHVLSRMGGDGEAYKREALREFNKRRNRRKGH